MKLSLLKKVSKVVHFTVSEIQTMDYGLCQPHFQGFFSPQQQLVLEKTPTLVTLRAILSLRKSINTVYEKYIQHKNP